METNQAQAWKMLVEGIERIRAQKGRGAMAHVAECLGINQSTVSRWLSEDEKGKRIPLAKIEAYMRKLGLGLEKETCR